jgi:hypothetical protein
MSLKIVSACLHKCSLYVFMYYVESEGHHVAFKPVRYSVLQNYGLAYSLVLQTVLT